ncbi:MAG TPA: 3-dehydroquinate dehydratase [Lysobacter sp.]
MSIAILTAGTAPAEPSGLPREVLSQLVERAALAGKTVAVRHCRTPADAEQTLRHCSRCGTEFLLIDPRHCNGADVGGQLDRAGVPYIVVHPDTPQAQARNDAHGHPLSVIDGYGAQGYVLALSIALEHLGCNDWENDVHVGT